MGLSIRTSVTVTVIVVCQLIGIALLPKTEGYSRVGYALASLALFAVSFAAMARLLRGGVALGTLVPALAAIVPLASVVVGIAIYGESASLPRIAMLVLACLLAGFASRY